ncbi:MAG: CidA/LrgA family protein [Gammaproteobacteria bacterium]|jgi:holin-like protein|nr:CidA/LrgA family protein [Gammaproteobacteria bacterium]
MEFLIGITVLLSYQLLGEVVVLVLDLPVPGPVIGMLFLFLTLLVRKRSSPTLDTAAGSLLSHLSLLFVPAGVGAMLHFQRIGSEWLPISAALVFSTLLTLVVTALAMKGLQRLLLRKGAVHE